MNKITLIFALALICFHVSDLHSQKQPNVLWIIGDDWGTHAGVYQTAAISTPNIDQLANEGVKYTNVFSTSPVCSAMRSALITGMYQTTIGAHHHRTASKPPLPDGVDVITRYFKDAGYYTSNGNSNQSGNGKTDYNFQGSFNIIFDGNDWRDRPTGKPFFSQVQIFNPHRSFFQRNTDPNRVQELELPAYYPDHELTRKDYADYLADVEVFDDRVGAILNRLQNDGLADNTIVMVFGDHGAPHVRDKQWLYDGGIRIPLIIRDPTGILFPAGQEGSTDDRMISQIDISATSLAVAGIEIPDHIQGVDFSDSKYSGREAVFAARDRSGGVVDRIRSVQVGNLKLIRNFYPNTPYMLGSIMESSYKHKSYPVHTLMKVMNGRNLLGMDQAKFLSEQRPEYELYDTNLDPNEFNNLFDDPAYAEQSLDLQNRLNAWISKTNDMGGNFDPDASQAYEEMLETFANTLSSRVAVDATDFEYLQWWADRYDVALNLPQTQPDHRQIKLPNRSFENTPLSNGAWDTNTAQGWTESFSATVQNPTASQMAAQAQDGENVLILNSDQGWARWALDDNWGNLVQFDEALWWQIELEAWIGRRSDFQGDDAGIFQMSLQDTAGSTIDSFEFNFDGQVAQGTWELQTFTFRLTRELVRNNSDQIFLAVGNIVEGLNDNRRGRVLLDNMSLSVSLIGDLDESGAWDENDLVLLHQNFGNPAFDVDGDGDCDTDDRDFLLNEIFGLVNGDANSDGVVNLLDVSDFILALSDPDAYEAIYPNSLPQYVNDFNYDGQLNLLDVNGFVNALAGN